MRASVPSSLRTMLIASHSPSEAMQVGARGSTSGEEGTRRSPRSRGHRRTPIVSGSTALVNSKSRGSSATATRLSPRLSRASGGAMYSSQPALKRDTSASAVSAAPVRNDVFLEEEFKAVLHEEGSNGIAIFVMQRFAREEHRAFDGPEEVIPELIA